MRIGPGARDLYVGLEGAGHLSQLAGEALDDPEIHARSLDSSTDEDRKPHAARVYVEPGLQDCRRIYGVNTMPKYGQAETK